MLAAIAPGQQKSPAISLTSLPRDGVLLQEGWRFQGGDDPKWIDPNYNDAQWRPVNPSKDIHYLPELKKAGHYWFRLHLLVDSTLRNKPIGLIINQVGSSEVYLNGKLIKTFTNNPKGKPVLIQFDGGGRQVIAVRYTVPAFLPYLNYNGFGNPFFTARLQELDTAFDNYALPVFTSLTNLLHFGVFLFLGIFHLFFYSSYKSRKVNLYFALYAFCFAVVMTGDPVFALFGDPVLLSVMVVVFYIAAAASEIFLVQSIYKLFNQPRDIFFWLVCVLCIVSVAAALLLYASGWKLIFLTIIFDGVAIMRVCQLAAQQKVRGARTAVVIQAFSTLLFIVLTIHVLTNIPMQENMVFFNSLVYQLPATIAFLCPPVFISYLLATDFGQLHQSLTRQLVEVEKLSAKTLAQEQEKQLLLASQNERLEREVTERTSLIVSQKHEIEAQRDYLESTLEDLKSAQEQLIIKEKEKTAAAFKSRTAELEMQALRAQMNPHFIFNSLNSINRFILTNDSDAAADYLARFSKLIRLVLQHSGNASVTLDKELEALRLYIDMEMLRFEGQFSYQITCDDQLEVEDIEVPPLIIQPYVENAIWHGLMHKKEKGELNIKLQRQNGLLLCEIIDNGVGRRKAEQLKSKSASKSKSLGMQITAHRLELINTLYEKTTVVEVVDLVDHEGVASGTKVLIKIPV
jgi:hypothetical protein